MKVDVIIIGSGQAGSPLATRLAGSGQQVVLIERAYLGGTCVNYGCTPTKTIIASARAAHAARGAGRLGVETGPVSVDFEAVMARKDRIVEQWRSGVERSIESEDGVLLVRGHGRFTGPSTVEADGRVFTAGTIIINTGARAALPPIDGLADVEWMDNADILELTALPPHLLIVGGGYIGCEFGQAFRRFGAEVTIVGRPHHLLPREDTEISQALEEVFDAEGIDLRLGRTARSVRPDGDEIVMSLDDGSEIRGSRLLIAAGRRPNTEDLGCEEAGVERDERGFVEVDEYYRTSVDSIYAAGDVTGGPQFTHTAWDDHRLLFDVLVDDGTRGRDDRLIPSTVFTDPQVARVGLNETEAEEQGIDFEVASMPFGHIARAIEVDETAGFMKVLIDPSTERVLGASIVGSEAGELVHIFTALMAADAPARTIVEMEAAHPTFAEGMQSLVMKLDRYRLS
ncbi:MAG: mercuric reductase [bacterium]